MSETPAYVKNLKKESVVQSVINCLTDAMRSKELKPGDRIPPEPELWHHPQSGFLRKPDGAAGNGGVRHYAAGQRKIQ